jgi:hypothetical protein
MAEKQKKKKKEREERRALGDGRLETLRAAGESHQNGPHREDWRPQVEDRGLGIWNVTLAQGVGFLRDWIFSWRERRKKGGIRAMVHVTAEEAKPSRNTVVGLLRVG